MRTSRVRGRTHRLINSRFPPVGVFDDIALSEEDKRAAFELESLTNNRLMAYDRLQLIPEGELVANSQVMAAFLHCSESGSRFCDPRLGAWYAALDLATAVEETIYHNHRRLAASQAGFPARIQIRELIVHVDAKLGDIRGARDENPELYHLDDYRASQKFGLEARWPFADPGIDGIAYDSVRCNGGQNVCIFRPSKVPPPVTQGQHLEYVWDAKGEVTVIELSEFARGSK